MGFFWNVGAAVSSGASGRFQDAPDPGFASSDRAERTTGGEPVPPRAAPLAGATGAGVERDHRAAAQDRLATVTNDSDLRRDKEPYRT
jgi:hypothetical protein